VEELKPDELENLKRWIDDHLGVSSSQAESKLVRELLLGIHTVDLDPFEEPMLRLDLTSE
jgi:hypothetical protein